MSIDASTPPNTTTHTASGQNSGATQGAPKTQASPSISVVLATYNRGKALKLLLDDLAHQTVDPKTMEVVVVDDGSKEPVAEMLGAFATPYHLEMKRQHNAGAAAARHLGVLSARGDIVIITDDDMRVDKDFVRAHLKAHEAGATVVLGQILSSSDLKHMPVFERFHAGQLERFVKAVRSNSIKARGVHVCTGNVSFRRQDYLRLGGFDQSLGRSEDRELGVRLEKNGATLQFCEGAKVIHESDHQDLNVWLRRAFLYGVFDRRIAQKHPDVENADPWRFLFLVNMASRPLLLGVVAFPRPAAAMTRLAMQAAMKSDALGFERLALMGTTLAYGLEYFRGMRHDAGSLTGSLHDFVGYWHKRKRASSRQ